MPTFDWRESVAEADIDAWGAEQWLALATRYEAAVNARGVNEWTAFVKRAQELAGQVQGPEWAAELRSTLDTLVEQLLPNQRSCSLQSSYPINGLTQHGRNGRRGPRRRRTSTNGWMSTIQS